MAIADNRDLEQYCRETAKQARRAAARLSQLRGDVKNHWLKKSAQLLRHQSDAILAANQEDLDAAPGYGLTDAQIDRLRLDKDRIDGIALGLEEVVALPDPVGEVLQSTTRPNGLEVSKVCVPLGVVFFIYESRPNVTADAAAICMKSGNAVILRGGKEAAHSSRAIVDILRSTAAESHLPVDAIQLVDTADRAAVGHFLAMDNLIDVAIPRGGESLIRRVASEARMPVIKHFTGNCHVYVDNTADHEMARQIVLNSKCQRMGVCNACESLLVHADIAAQWLPQLGRELIQSGIEIRGDSTVCELIPEAETASDQDYFTEYLGPILSIKLVTSLDEAIDHIDQYGSHHTDTIVTNDLMAARKFASRVDSSAVMINASTRFNDGGQFGLGAEIGISTDRFHARGPCGLKELTTYKYIVYGNGQIRE